MVQSSSSINIGNALQSNNNLDASDDVSNEITLK